MTDETGTDNHPSDVVSAEEFLFGNAGNDAPVGEVPFGDDMDDVADDSPAKVADAGDADNETAEEPDVADDAEERPAPTETETTEELKVVLSIKGGRATIGVQCPSADPHIESFDDPDLFGLADQFPAVVARARARWEEEPMNPAYQRPTPPATRPRGQNSAQEATAPAEAEPEQQQQPETLRLF